MDTVGIDISLCRVQEVDKVVGKTRTEGGKKEDTDLSLATLLSDFLGVIEHLFRIPKEAPSLLVRSDSLSRMSYFRRR